MKKLLQELRASSLEAIGNADNSEALEALRVKYLGKKGELTAVLKQMGRLSAEERPVMGKLANEVRADLEQALADCKTRLEARAGSSMKRWTSPCPAARRSWGTVTRCTPFCARSRISSSAWALTSLKAPRSSCPTTTSPA